MPATYLNPSYNKYSPPQQNDIIRRSKLYLNRGQPDVSSQTRLPNIANVNSNYNSQLRAMNRGILPPIVAAGHGMVAQKYPAPPLERYDYPQYRHNPNSLNRDTKIGQGISGVRLQNVESHGKLSSYSGNYGSPQKENPKELTPVQPYQRKALGNSKIGTGVLKY